MIVNETNGIMKNITALLFIFLAGNTSLFSQAHPILDNFYIVESNGSVVLNWTIKGGSTCNGIQIFRSTDSINFSQVGEIVGVCGGSSAPQPYDFTDSSPVKNKVNYYKLQLGQEGFTSVISIEIIEIGKNGNQVRPNPAKDNARIYFANNRYLASNLILYDPSGTILLKQNSDLDYFDLDLTGIPGGAYVFAIFQEGNISTTGRIIIVK